MQNVQAQKSFFFVGGDIPNKVLRFRAGRGHCCLDLRSASFWVCLVLLHLSFLSDLLCLLLICESSKSIFLFCTCGISQQAGSAKSSLVFLRFFLSLFFSFYHFVFVLSSVLPGFQISQSCITGHQSHLDDKYKNISFCLCTEIALLWHLKQNLQQTRRRTKRRWPCFSHLQGEPSQ